MKSLLDTDELLDIDKNVKVVKDMLRWAPIVIGGYLGKNVDLGLGITIVIMTCAYYLGDWVAKWYFRRKVINKKVVSFISWVNLISWIMPPLGIFTASLAYRFYVQSKPNSNKKHRNLAIVGAVLSILSELINFILQKMGY